MVGIILAGGTGSRLGPITRVTSKQLLPIYDKPMVFYPLSLLMASGLREIIIISSTKDLDSYKQLLGDGSQWGIDLKYVAQPQPNGLPEAFLLTEKLIRGRNTTLILGDNILYGSQIGRRVGLNTEVTGAHIYGYLVKDASSFGVIELSEDATIKSLIEKPANARNSLAIPGLYHFDDTVAERTKYLVPSLRGELEIVDLLSSYLNEGQLGYSVLDRGNAWLDTGTIHDLFMAAELVHVLQTRQGMMIGSPDEVAFRSKWINEKQINLNIQNYNGSLYADFLRDLILN